MRQERQSDQHVQGFSPCYARDVSGECTRHTVYIMQDAATHSKRRLVHGSPGQMPGRLDTLTSARTDGGGAEAPGTRGSGAGNVAVTADGGPEAEPAAACWGAAEETPLGTTASGSGLTRLAAGTPAGAEDAG